MPSTTATRLLAVLLAFAAALGAFLLLRGPDPAAPARAAAPPPARDGSDDLPALQAARARRAGRRRARASRSPRPTSAAPASRATPRFYARADGLLRAVLARAPRDPGALVASAGLALSRHDFRRGLALARRARAARPAALAPAPLIVDALVELGRFGAAERTLQRLVDTKPTLAGYARVSYLRELHGDLAGAVAAMRRAVAAGGAARESTASAHALLGGLELARGRLARAPSWPSARRWPPSRGIPPREAGLARIAAARGDLAGAARRWRGLAARLPLPEYVVGLAETRLAQGRPAAARRQLELVAAERRLLGAAGVDTDAEAAVYRGRPRLAPPRAGARPPGLGRRARAPRGGRTGLGADPRRAPAAGLRWAHRALALGSRDPLLRHHAGLAALAAGRTAEGRAHLRLALAGGLAGWPWQAQQAHRAQRGGAA